MKKLKVKNIRTPFRQVQKFQTIIVFLVCSTRPKKMFCAEVIIHGPLTLEKFSLYIHAVEVSTALLYCAGEFSIVLSCKTFFEALSCWRILHCPLILENCPVFSHVGEFSTVFSCRRIFRSPLIRENFPLSSHVGEFSIVPSCRKNFLLSSHVG